MEAYESVLLIKQEVFVYKIPPRTTNRGYRAADWNLNEPAWSGRLRMVARDTALEVKLEDKTTGQLYAKCPIEAYPGVAIESVSDSSRYFVLRIQDDNGRSAFIGLGFGDRSDSFDMNVALQDHFKWVKNQEQIEKEKTDGPKENLNLGFKEGETIKINMKIRREGQEGSGRTGKSRTAGTGLLPPPPSAPKLPSPSSAGTSPAHKPTGQGTDWGEYTSSSSSTTDAAGAAAANSSTTPTNSNWVQF
uniref:CSON005029 protein n=1 Tax=Culicoides sonorensis TaxID=179676 RepID=A0A336N267_CULSO